MSDIRVGDQVYHPSLDNITGTVVTASKYWLIVDTGMEEHAWRRDEALLGTGPVIINDPNAPFRWWR